MDARTPRATKLDEKAYFANRFLWLNALLQNLNDREKRNVCRIELVYQDIFPSDSDVWFQESCARAKKSAETHNKLNFVTDGKLSESLYIDLSEYTANYLTSENFETLGSTLEKKKPIIGLVFDEDEAAKFSHEQLTALAQLISKSNITKILGLKKVSAEMRGVIDAALAKNCHEALRRQSITAIPSLAQTGSARLLRVTSGKPTPEEKQADKILNSTGTRP